mmetsp:Transcript_3507/g.9270  ORF Transcript_3507/g.9270 Transcript_3507/m.9270 type:complete len:206 (+) Transcript_3507:336-953(+)
MEKQRFRLRLRRVPRCRQEPDGHRGAGRRHARTGPAGSGGGPDRAGGEVPPRIRHGVRVLRCSGKSPHRPARGDARSPGIVRHPHQVVLAPGLRCSHPGHGGSEPGGGGESRPQKAGAIARSTRGNVQAPPPPLLPEAPDVTTPRRTRQRSDIPFIDRTQSTHTTHGVTGITASATATTIATGAIVGRPYYTASSPDPVACLFAL